MDIGERAEDPLRSTRVAWLMPSLARGYYWQPVFREFTIHFPETVIFTGLWPGFLRGYEGAINVRELPGFRFVVRKRNESGTEIGFVWASVVGIVRQLIGFHPRVIFADSFTIWTMCALVFKALTHARVIVVWDGVSPGVACLESPWRLWIRRVLAHFSDDVVANSRDGARYLRDVLRLPESKLLNHPILVPETNAMCLDGNYQVAENMSCKPTFLFVGNLVKGKGWRYLLEAAKHLVEDEIGPFSVVFAGSGPEREELQSLSSVFGLSEVIKLTGQVSYERIGTLFGTCDVFVLPTLEDVWGMVVLEAMAFGKPVLCSEYAGSKEMIEHGGNGFIFNPYRPRELAQFMARFIQEPSLVADFGARSREIMSLYTPARAAGVLATLARNVLRPERRAAVPFESEL